MGTSVKATLRLFSGGLHHQRYISQQCFLSPSYRCDEAWNERLEHSPVKSIKPVDFYYDIDRKYRSISKVFALDTDLLVNKLTSDDMINFTSEVDMITERLRKSPDTKIALPSTTHAVLRLLLDVDNKDLILKMLTAPEKYGIFPDFHAWNLMLDHFLSKKDHTTAARIASILMLQEDFGPPITQNLSMLSCLYWAMGEKEDWKDYHPPEPEPEDEVKVRVKYITKPYDDFHFDLKDPTKIVGKTLEYGSFHFDGFVAANLRILGLTMQQRWDKLIPQLVKEVNGTNTFDLKVVEKIKNILEKVECEPKESILAKFGKLKVEDLDLLVEMEDLVKAATQNHQDNDIDSQVKIYRHWNTLRENEINRTLAELEKIKMIDEIEKKKEILEKEEERIFFFENENKIKLMISEKKVFMEEEERSLADPKFAFKLKKVRVDLGEEYIPPDVQKRHT